MPRANVITLDQIGASGGFGLSVTAERNGLALNAVSLAGVRSTTPEPTTAPASDVLAFVPRQAFAVISFASIDRSLGGGLEQAKQDPFFESLDQQLGLTDAIGHLTGLGGLEVGPGQPPFPVSGAVLLGTDDEASTRGFLDRVADLVGLQLAGPERPITAQHETYRGVDISYLDLADVIGTQPAYTITQGMAIVATSRGEIHAILDAKASGSTISAAPTFQQSLGGTSASGSRFLMYADVEAVVGLIRNQLSGPDLSAFDTNVRQYVAPIKGFVITVRTDTPTRGSVRAFVLIR